jgi:hypothetical protein
MGWATMLIAKLQAGETVQFRPRGHSMRGKVENKQLCTVAPINPEQLEVGDIVLCKVSGQQYLHLIVAREGEHFLIGNNRGGINGWIGKHGVYGRLTRVED